MAIIRFECKFEVIAQKLCYLFDIKDMCTNIPQQDTTHIIHNMLSKDKENLADDIHNMLRIILQQNYFQFDNQYYKQNIGLTMGAPTSAVIAETYLQHLEHNLKKRKP
jgi:hypothetical protein